MNDQTEGIFLSERKRPLFKGTYIPLYKRNISNIKEYKFLHGLIRTPYRKGPP